MDWKGETQKIGRLIHRVLEPSTIGWGGWVIAIERKEKGQKEVLARVGND